MPPESFTANSANMHYPLGSLDGQDLIEAVRQSSGKVLWACALSEVKAVLKGKPWNSKRKNFPRGSQSFSTNPRNMPRTKFHLGGLLSANRQRSTINTKRWLDVNEVFKAPHPCHSNNWLQHDSHPSPPPLLPPLPPPQISPRSWWIAMISSEVRNVRTGPAR